MNPYDRIHLLERAVKKLKFQLCCIDNEVCPPISADADNIIECRADGLYSAGGGGDAPSWQATLDVGNTTETTLIYNDPQTPDINSEKIWHEYKVLDPTHSDVNSSWYHNQSVTMNEYPDDVFIPNEVMSFGWNVNPGGGIVEAGKPGIGMFWEQNYNISLGRLLEIHTVYLRSSDGTQLRLDSYTINDTLNTVSFYTNTHFWEARSPDFNLPYVRLQGYTDIATITMSNVAEDGAHFQLYTDFGSTTPDVGKFIISQSSGQTTNVFSLGNFNQADLPGTVTLNPIIGDTTQLSFHKGDGTQQMSISHNATRTLINSQIGSIGFAATNVEMAEFFTDYANIRVHTKFGSNTVPIAFVDVEQASERVSMYVDNTSAIGTNYGLILNVTVSGGANARALNITAGGGAENIAIRIDGPQAAAAANYAIKSEVLSKATFAGPMNIGGADRDADAVLNMPTTGTTVGANGISWGNITLFKAGSGTLSTGGGDIITNVGIEIGSTLGLFNNPTAESAVIPSATGIRIRNNTNDANAALVVDKAHGSATGHIVDFQSANSNKVFITYDGDIEVVPVGKGVIIRSPDTTRWRLTPSNAGVSVWTLA